MAAMSSCLIYSPILEVSGKVHWSCACRVATPFVVRPGKLMISKLADSFYITCMFDSGNAGSPSKLITSATMDNITCLNGRFTFYSKVDGSTRFVLEEGDENSLEKLMYCMTEIKRGNTPVLQTVNKSTNSHHQSPAQAKPVAMATRTRDVQTQTDSTHNVEQSIKKEAPDQNQDQVGSDKKDEDNERKYQNLASPSLPVSLSDVDAWLTDLEKRIKKPANKRKIGERATVIGWRHHIFHYRCTEDVTTCTWPGVVQCCSQEFQKPGQLRYHVEKKHVKRQRYRLGNK